MELSTRGQREGLSVGLSTRGQREGLSVGLNTRGQREGLSIPSSIPKWAPVGPIRGPFGAQLCPTGA